MRLTKLHHVMVGVTDIETTDRFTTDFGLLTVKATDDLLVKRTSGGDAYCYVAQKSAEPAFIGIALAAEGMDDLHEAVEHHGATPIRELEHPGGGYAVTLTDPDGMRIDIVTGIAEAEAVTPAADIRVNSPANRQRLNAPQTPRGLAPAYLYRLGHVGLYVTNFERSYEWYSRVLNMKASELLHYGEPTKPGGAFMRLNRGDTATDHHTLFIMNWRIPGLHHASYEAQDFEAQFRSHEYLRSKGWELNWGVGRHALGSHVFDVWFDPDRFRFETFSDTDWLTEDSPTNVQDIREHSMDIWSSDPPDRYFA